MTIHQNAFGAEKMVSSARILYAIGETPAMTKEQLAFRRWCLGVVTDAALSRKLVLRTGRLARIA
jgi:hypothetical protein